MKPPKLFSPKLGLKTYIHPTATVLGRVFLGDRASVWPGAVLRGDLNCIVVGKYTNIQDLSVLHVERDLDCQVGD